MHTKNRHIKVKIRNDAVLESHKKVSILKCAQESVHFDINQDLSTILMAGDKCYHQSVLNSLKQTELRCMPDNIIADPASKNLTKQSRSTHLNSLTKKSFIISKGQNYNMILAILITLHLLCSTQSILVEEQSINLNAELNPMSVKTITSNSTSFRNTGKSITSNSTGLSPSSVAASGGYLDKLDNLERSVAAVLIKVAYGTTSTTKRSIPDNSYVLGLTTVATPLLTTLRYHQSVHHAQQHNGGRHRNYELDLERDHALPTSAPNADILKSNNNPTYPNPNRHHSSSSGTHDRDRQRHPPMQYNSTPTPSIPNLLKKSNGQPTIPMYPGDIPSYSPPSRSFFTPPLPPEYQNPFADKPTLRGTNNEGIISNTVAFNNRRPIPPPSLMPGHERIPLRPPDLAASIGNVGNDESDPISVTEAKNPLQGGANKKALNTPSSRNNDAVVVVAETAAEDYNNNNNHNTKDFLSSASAGGGKRQKEVLPNIQRILGSNGKKVDIPAVLLRHVTQRPIVSSFQQQTPAAPKVLFDNNADAADNAAQQESSNSSNISNAANINKSRQPSDSNDITNVSNNNSQQSSVTTTPSAAAALGEAAATSSAAATTTNSAKPTFPTTNGSSKVGVGVGAGATAAASAHATWTWAWNIHIYLCVVLFTILSVYSLYKLVTYNKLTHLFAQSYFVYIHLILISICIMRIIYLCIDAYNIHSTFPIFAAELLFNLPSTFLTVAFAVLILFLFLKSLNHKNNRYSALVRPLTVVVGCGVHVGLCITLHYVESYTLHNHQLYFQQQQQQQYFRRQQQQQQQQLLSTSLANPPSPPRVLSLICQIIYIFICISLGLLYLYLYRILKRILKSKSQNYIHGYQNLSYAIHITIATALLFVLLAALQIFGAVCISTATRPSMSQANIVDVDWLQWGYQFSLRLIEIAIITLVSWVTGLRTSIGIGNNVNNAGVAVNGDLRMVGPVVASREKHPTTTTSSTLHNTNVANFFLPCTSSSSQEQFDTDYPAICNTNTNLHTYTMRTGKLIYDDSYALNSLSAAGGGGGASPSGGTGTEYQLQEPMYQRPYDTGSIRSAVNHNLTSRFHQHHHPHHHSHPHQIRGAAYMSNDYMTDDATIDHYENPNFDLRTSSTGAVVGALQKLGSGSGTGFGTGSGTGSGSSQQQMLLLQSDSCYSEPLQENSSYEFNNFERPVFKEREKSLAVRDEFWPEGQQQQKVQVSERRTSSNSTTNSCTSSNGGGGRFANNYNSYERGAHCNGVRKSGTLNSITNGGGGTVVMGPVTSSSFNRAINNVTPGIMRVNGAQTLAHSTERSYYQRTSGRGNNNVNLVNRSLATTNDFELESRQHQNKQQQHQQKYNHRNSELDDGDDDDDDDDGAEEEEEEDDDMITGSNVECTNLISNANNVEHNSCLTNDDSSSITNSQLNVQKKKKNSKSIQQFQHPEIINASSIPEPTNDSAIANVSDTSSSIIVTDSGFVPRYRVNKDEINNKHHLGVVPGHQQKQTNRNLTQICSNVNGIDC